jgi:hypothetical protein
MKKIYTVMVAIMAILSSFCVQAQADHLTISQVYGGGGNSGATYKNDFIELFNPTNATVDLTGWSVQYASSTGTSWQVTPLNGSIAPGHYYLVKEAAGTGGTVDLPAPDATGSIAMAAGAGKVALVNSTAALTGSCPTAIDFVGFGSTANCFEGTGTTPAPSATLAVFRANAGCTDSNNNAADFSTVAPAPRNSSTLAHLCSGTASSSVSVAAGNNAAEPSANGSFQLTLSSPAPAGGVTVNYTLSGTATAGTDYSNAQTGTITIPEGSTLATLEITVNDDAELEGAETIILTIAKPSGYELSTATATIELADNEKPAPAKIIINQVYGGGGNSGAVYTNDFIELYNNENVPVNLSGWSVQYSSAGGTGSWATTTLSGSIPAHGFFLVQEAKGSAGTIALPTPDAVGTIAMSGSSGKVLLSNATTAQAGADPSGPNVIDKVGYGSATGFETAPTPATDNTTAVKRITDGVDTDNNAVDFDLAEPLPRNSTYTTTPPVILSVNPPDGRSGVPYNIVPTILFNKPIQKASGNITLLENGVTILIDVNSSNIVMRDKFTMAITLPLSGGKTYTVQIPAGAFKDVYGNEFAGNTWSFSTYDNSVPVTLPASFDFQDCPGNGLLPNGFTGYSIAGSAAWDCTPFGRDASDPLGKASAANAIQMNGFTNGTNVPNADWLISPAFDLAGTTYPLLTFWSRTAFNGRPLQLKVSTNYISGDPSLATWTDVNGRFPEQASDVWTVSPGINLSAFKQSNVHFAFVYTSSDEEGARWTVDDISLVNSLTPPPPALTIGSRDIQFRFAAAGQTADKSFEFIGNDLTEGITISTSGDFLVSKDGINYSASISYTPEEANNVFEKAFVRFAPSVNNQDFTASVNITTSGLNGTISLKGTSIDPATTLEVVNWNMEWFGSTDPTLGPVNNDLQQQNAETVIKAADADIYGLVEVVDEQRLANIVSHMPGYSYVICNFGSHVNPPEAGGGPLSAAQKEAFVYKTSLFSNVTTRPLVNAAPGTTSYNNWSSGRYPFLFTANLTMNCVTEKVNFVLIHAKANTSPTATAYARRQAAANELHDTLQAYFAAEKVVILGDFNDDLDKSITAGFTTTSYSAFTSEPDSFYSPTLELSLAGKKSTASYNDIIDHVVLTNEMAPYYMPSSATILTDVASDIAKYSTTTSDHYPVYTRYRFANTTAPVVSNCTPNVTYCSIAAGTYAIPVFTAADDCDANVNYSFTITGSTERTGTGNNATGAFNVGTSTINWNVTDSWGNATTCSTTVVINQTPAVVIADSYILPQGVTKNTVYTGYAPAGKLKLTATATATTESFSYTWTAGTGLAIVPGTEHSAQAEVYSTAPGNYTSSATVVVANASGCTATATITIAVVDVRSGRNLDKVAVCHLGIVLSINSTDVQYHLSHGDPLGSCGSAITNARISNSNELGSLAVSVRPNPSSAYFTLQVNESNTPLHFTVTDMLGRIVEQKNLAPGQLLQFGQQYHPGLYLIELNNGSDRKLVRVIKTAQ